MSTPCIIDVEGAVLTHPERDVLRRYDPCAMILFARSCETPGQLRALCADIRDALGRDCLIMIDQEGGRVQRLRPPVWPQFPEPALYGQLYRHDRARALEACRLHFLLTGLLMAEAGVNCAAAPCLDVRTHATHDVIGNRAFSEDPKAVAELGGAALAGLAEVGIVGVIKHLPGHGRACVDSHFDLPHITCSPAELASDLAPFQAQNDAPIGMVGHLVIDHIDADRPASQSPTLIAEVIRQSIGFQGMLISDDMTMQALTGSDESRLHKALSAGLDAAIYRHLGPDRQAALLDQCPAMTAQAQARLATAEALTRAPRATFDPAAAWARFAALTDRDRAIVVSIGDDPTRAAWI